jgi:hypothetical protein
MSFNDDRFPHSRFALGAVVVFFAEWAKYDGALAYMVRVRAFANCLFVSPRGCLFALYVVCCPNSIQFVAL